MKMSIVWRPLIVSLLLAVSSSALAGWYNASWAYRKAITIDHTQVSNTDQTSFPVLVSLTSDADLAAHAQSSGNDILFTSGDGVTKISYQREQYGGGTLVAWVNVATLSSTTDTVLYLYYGNPGATDQEDLPGAVWDPNYKGVWHLDENPKGTAPQFLDSTAGANKGTAGGTFVTGDQQTGQIYDGLHYGGAANLAIANQSNFGFQYNNPFSIEYWANPGSSTAKQSPISKLQNSGSYPGYEICHNTADVAGNNSPGYLRVILVNSAITTTHQIVVSTANATQLNDGNWHHYVYTYSGSGTAAGVAIYEDGVALATMSGEDSLSSKSILNTTAVNLGSRANAGLYYNGSLDEVRISSAVRSPDWIATEYNNQSSPATFYALGTEQTISAITSVSSSLNPSTYGQSITFTATVSGAGSTPSGTVNFFDGATALGSGKLDGSGQTTLSLGSLSAGFHVITAHIWRRWQLPNE